MVIHENDEMPGYRFISIMSLCFMAFKSYKPHPIFVCFMALYTLFYKDSYLIYRRATDFFVLFFLDNTKPLQIKNKNQYSEIVPPSLQ